MWFPYSVRTAGTWHTPLGIQVSGNLSFIKPSWSGPIVYRLDRSDPQVLQFGPSTVTSETGSRQSNPLSTRERFRCATRSECQELLPVVVQLGLKLQYRIPLGGTHEALIGGNILNLLNGGNGFEWARGGANREYAGPSIFLQPGNLQPPRSFQIDLQYRF